MTSNDEMEKNETIIRDEEIVTNVADIETLCTICHAEFLDPNDLNIHLEQIHKITRSVLRKCQFCPEEYSDLLNYAEHIRDFHLTSLKCCGSCWRVFNDFDAYRKHSRLHFNNSPNVLNCSQCPQRFGDPAILKKHEFDHKTHQEGVMMYEVLPYLSAVLKVKAITFLDSLDTDVVYKCSGCNFSTVDMNSYLRHVRSNNCTIFVCHQCGNVYKEKKSLIEHTQSDCNIFSIKGLKTRLCQNCNMYVSSRLYSKHKTYCKPIKCYTCDIMFNSMNEWSEHQSKEHAGMSLEVESCKFCWKRCVGSVALKKHIDKTHKPNFHLYKYLCVYCKSVFKHPQKLFTHFVSQHKDISPYTCKICDKTFRFRKKLTIHIKLEHNSVGFVEFDENYHVFFTDKRSENPFIPKSIYTSEGTKLSENSGNAELNSDFMNATETEGNQTEVENDKPKLKRKKRATKKGIKDNQTKIKPTVKPRLKRKRRSNTPKEDTIILESSDDDEPLLAVRKRVLLQKKQSENGLARKRGSRKINKPLLTCKICNKYCYTYQNYNHHVSLHSKHEVKKCIKCSKIFRSKSKLNEHIASEHTTSKLTETLKTLLEKRKTGGSLSEDLPSAVKFRRTIKKVPIEKTPTAATITAVDHKLSVQKFFENFIPEENKNEMPIQSKATIKIVSGFHREPTIKMKKFQSPPISTSQRLSMPVKFVDNHPEKVHISIKFVPPVREERNEYYSDHYDDNDMDRHDTIPEVAEEVLLEGTEEIPKNQNEFAHKIIIPKLPSEISDIRIAHLLPQAPYYKIVKVRDVLVKNEEKPDLVPPSAIKLADGTKFVTTNPLAHLLGNKPEKVLESVKNKYYKPKNKNFPGMLAKALTMLDKPTPPRKKRRQDIAGMPVEEPATVIDSNA